MLKEEPILLFSREDCSLEVEFFNPSILNGDCLMAEERNGLVGSGDSCANLLIAAKCNE